MELVRAESANHDGCARSCKQLVTASHPYIEALDRHRVAGAIGYHAAVADHDIEAVSTAASTVEDVVARPADEYVISGPAPQRRVPA